MNADEMLGIQDTVFILTGGINDLRSKVLSVVLDNSAECILDSRVIALYENAIDKADGKGGFSCNWALLAEESWRKRET